MNARLRKVTRNRGQFPSEQAALKVLYLAVRNLEEFRSPTAGLRSSGWKQALQAFTIYFEGRIPTHDRHDHLHRRSDAPGRDRGARRR
jgi:transposase-like protein